MALTLTQTDLRSGSVMLTSEPSSVCNFASRHLPCVMFPDSKSSVRLCSAAFTVCIDRCSSS